MKYVLRNETYEYYQDSYLPDDAESMKELKLFMTDDIKKAKVYLSIGKNILDEFCRNVNKHVDPDQRLTVMEL